MLSSKYLYCLHGNIDVVTNCYEEIIYIVKYGYLVYKKDLYHLVVNPKRKQGSRGRNMEEINIQAEDGLRKLKRIVAMSLKVMRSWKMLRTNKPGRLNHTRQKCWGEML